MCQIGFTIQGDITQTIKEVFYLKQDFHLVDALQSWKKLITLWITLKVKRESKSLVTSFIKIEKDILLASHSV